MFEHYSWYNQLPPENLSAYEPNLKLFFETMYERQMIWKRRFIDKKERPWTNDVILRDYKFTNVYRELDRNSQWQINNILLDEKISLKNLVWKLMFFRFFNNPETFTFEANNQTVQLDAFKDIKLISASKWRNGIPDWEEYDVEEFSQFIAGIRSTGRNPFTTAYLVFSGLEGTRDDNYTKTVIPTLHSKINTIIKTTITAKTPEEIISLFCTLPCTALFIAHEFYQDFTYIPKYTDINFMRFTQDDFTNVGPGASVGIRLIFPNLKGKEQKQAIYWLRDMASEELNEIAEKHGEPMPYIVWNKKERHYDIQKECNITLHQIEMWLCEFQKYWKMMIGVGKQRSKFHPKQL